MKLYRQNQNFVLNYVFIMWVVSHIKLYRTPLVTIKISLCEWAWNMVVHGLDKNLKMYNTYSKICNNEHKCDYDPFENVSHFQMKWFVFIAYWIDVHKHITWCIQFDNIFDDVTITLYFNIKVNYRMTFIYF